MSALHVSVYVKCDAVCKHVTAKYSVILNKVYRACDSNINLIGIQPLLIHLLPSIVVMVMLELGPTPPEDTTATLNLYAVAAIRPDNMIEVSPCVVIVIIESSMAGWYVIK